MSDALPIPPAELRQLLSDLHWMARRYAQGRSTYATSLFNDITRRLLAAGVLLNPTADQRLCADDGMGDAYAGLTPADRAAEQAYVQGRRGPGPAATP